MKISKEEFARKAKLLDIKGCKEAWDIYYDDKIEQAFLDIGRLFMYIQALKYEKELYEELEKYKDKLKNTKE